MPEPNPATSAVQNEDEHCYEKAEWWETVYPELSPEEMVDLINKFNNMTCPYCRRMIILRSV